jgi:hypothetical protein
MGRSRHGGSEIPIRPDLVEAEERAWAWLARPGTWLDASQKLAIAAETRNAHLCRLCRKRRDALSPYQVPGEHDSLGELSEAMVDVVHRIRTDSGRLTRTWYGQVLESGVSDGEYVETIGVIATITALDTFSRAYGCQQKGLPRPIPGAPSKYRPAGAKHQLAWVPTLEPGDITPDDPDIYAAYHPPYNIQRALSLVPDAMMAFFDFDETCYLSEQEILDFDTEYRALSHDQMELIAARLSALNGCYY